MSNPPVRQSSNIFVNRAAIATTALFFGCCGILLLPGTLGGFIAYEYALQAAYGMARTATIIGLISGCLATALLAKSGLSSAFIFVLAAIVAAGASASAFGAAMTHVPMAATVVLPTTFFTLAAPILIAAGAFAMAPVGLLRRLVAGLLLAVMMAVGAAGAFHTMSDDLDRVRIALAVAALAMLVAAALSAWTRRSPVRVMSTLG